MNILDLLVLGFLWQQEGHGYQIKERLKEAPRGWWDNLLPGAWYHHLNRLTSLGYLEGAAPVQQGKRPPKRTYRLTQAGEAYLVKLINKCVACSLDEWGLVVTFLGILTPGEQADLLKRRIEFLKAQKSLASSETLITWLESLRRHQVRWITDYLGKLPSVF